MKNKEEHARGMTVRLFKTTRSFVERRPFSIRHEYSSAAAAGTTDASCDKRGVCVYVLLVDKRRFYIQSRCFFRFRGCRSVDSAQLVVIVGYFVRYFALSFLSKRSGSCFVTAKFLNLNRPERLSLRTLLPLFKETA